LFLCHITAAQAVDFLIFFFEFFIFQRRLKDILSTKGNGRLFFLLLASSRAEEVEELKSKTQNAYSITTH
jgi:hypothetical protein